MDIDQIDNKTLKHFPAGSGCEINCLHIKIKDFKPIVQEFETYISDTSWINNLDEISKKAFKVNAEEGQNILLIKYQSASVTPLGQARK